MLTVHTLHKKYLKDTKHSHNPLINMIFKTRKQRLLDLREQFDIPNDYSDHDLSDILDCEEQYAFDDKDYLVKVDVPSDKLKTKIRGVVTLTTNKKCKGADI